jgi:hypothetical protein
MKKLLFTLLFLLLPTLVYSQVTMVDKRLDFTAPIGVTTLNAATPAREWRLVDLKPIDARFAQVTAVDVDATIAIAGPGIGGINCQVWVEYGKLGYYPTIQTPGGAYQQQMLHDSRDINPTYQHPRKRIGLVHGMFAVALAYEPGCLFQVDLALASALVNFGVPPDPAYTIVPVVEGILDYDWQLAFHANSLAPNQQHVIDLKTIDSRFATVRSVRVNGILIQGPTTVGEHCYLDVYLPNAHFFSNAPRNGGSRTSIPDRITMPYYDIPLTNGTVSLMYTITPGCGSGFNLKFSSVRF